MLAALLVGVLDKSAGLIRGSALRTASSATRSRAGGGACRSSGSLSMVATPEKQTGSSAEAKKLAKIEQIKIDSLQLREPLRTEMQVSIAFAFVDPGKLN